jgi:hypothetical protein
MLSLSRFFPWMVGAAASAYLVLAMVPVREPAGQFQLHEFAKIPVVDGGRVKPIDTQARTSLMIVSHRQTFRDDQGKSQPAIKWLLDAMLDNRIFNQHAAQKYPVFRIENDQLLKLLGREARPQFWRYSMEELKDKIPELLQRAERARNLPAKERDLLDDKVLELVQHLQLYMGLANLETAYVVPPALPGQEWQPFLGAFLQARQSTQDNANAVSYGRLLLAYSPGKAWAAHLPATDLTDPEDADPERLLRQLREDVYRSFLLVAALRLRPASVSARSVNSCVGSLSPNRESGSRPGIGCSVAGPLRPRLTFSEIRILKANPLENRGKPRHSGNSSGPLKSVNPSVGFPD